MNLRALAGRVVAIVNPTTVGDVYISQGYETLADGSQVAKYSIIHNIEMDVQALSTRDIMQIQNMNIGGSSHTVYLNGRVDGLIRSEKKGGDLLKFNGKTWLITGVLEHWQHWSKVSVTLQGD